MSDGGDQPPLDERLRGARGGSRWKRIGRVALGIGCVLFGIIGGLVPILQGWMFIALGATLLAPDFPPARRAMNWVYRRWPKVRRLVPRRYRRMGRAATPTSPAASSEASIGAPTQDGPRVEPTSTEQH